ncbi:MAG TPA: hypothetical protein P5081_04410 [Phycisphaerae bacterium]|nr:hypothetical protein [Phycisphaerae bacterium]HRW52104.1 hypothetical protein [Phycisphaerae bacterium]
MRAGICAGLVLLVGAAPGLAQPVNDDCADAIPIGNGVTPYSTIDATTDGPVNQGCPFGGQTFADIWFEYTATCTDTLTISTCGTVDYDSDLAIYNGCDCGNLQLLGCNDDTGGCSGFSTILEAPVVAGNCYLIRVGGFNSISDQGSGTISLQCGPPTPIGACCLPDMSCSQVLESECDTAGGVFQGVGFPCVPSPCAGACCAFDGTCTTTNWSDCVTSGGAFTFGADCGSVACTGACCEPDGACQILSEGQCDAASGVYTAGADCQSVSCSGSCCLPDDTCVIQSPLGCDALNGNYNGNGSACTPQLCEEIGPDVVLSDSTSLGNHGPIGGIRAVTLGSNTCNIGDQNLLWSSDGTPGLAENAYRLYDGQLQQIGMSWLKTACCAAAGSGCGLACNGTGGNMLGAGCLDVYGAGFNAIQSNKAARSGVNGFTGVFDPLTSGSFNDIDRRLQMHESDLNSTNFPGALYFLEGMYVATDDAAAGNAMNNASYRRATVGGTGALSWADFMQTSVPGIYAWRDHGGGLGVPDPTIEYAEVDVPLEGRFIFASKVDDLGAGLYRYTYNVFNFNSHRSADALSVPIPAGANVTNIGFHDVDYHSGDPYDNTDWTSGVDMVGNTVTWQSPDTFANNPNTNALRWGTMYTFWFTIDAPPAMGSVELSLFRPGTPTEITATVHTPLNCAGGKGDVNTDGLKNGLDVHSFSECLLTGATGAGSCTCADMDASGAVDMADIAAFVGALLGA